MFERFTDRARRVMVLAQENARGMRHNFIGTEHLLLGLIDEDDGVAARAIQSLGLDGAAVRAKVEELVPAGEADPHGSAPFTPRAKKSFELALREALQLGHNYIGTEHLLLGILREGEGVAVKTLRDLGAAPDEVRRAVVALLEGTERSARTARSDGHRFWSAGLRPHPLPGVRVAGSTRRQFDTSGPVDIALSDGKLTGVAAGLPVDLDTDLPASSGKAEGTFAGAPVNCEWRLAPNDQWAPHVPGWAQGSFGGEAADLLGWFHLSPDCMFQDAAIDGAFAGQPLSILVQAGPGPDSPGPITLSGTLSGSGFSLVAEEHRDGVTIEGSIDGKPMRLQATRSVVGSAALLRKVTGEYVGPAPILFLVTAAALHFA